MHKRRALLEALRTQLQTLPNYGGVWIQRISPTRNLWPAITLYAESETAEISTINVPMCFTRQVSLVVTVWIRGTQDDEKLEEDYDNAAVDIESKLSLPIGSDALILTGTQFQFDEADPEINAISFNYLLEYSALEGSPEV